MDELTLLRNTRDDEQSPTSGALADGRNALLSRARAASSSGDAPRARNGMGVRPTLRRLSWPVAGLAVGATVVLVVGNISFTAQTTYASEVLRNAATQAIHYADLVPGSSQYLRARTHARWESCADLGSGDWVCEPNVEILDVFMPEDESTEWVLYRDWGNQKGIVTGESIETVRAFGGVFYGLGSWIDVDYSDIPTEGAAAYDWIDAQYSGGSVSRDENNFVRITGILRTGLVPAAPRAALLDALSRIPGVAATDNVANFDGVEGVAIGRNEPIRSGERQEIIIDPETGLVIGERILIGTTLFGWGQSEEWSLTAIETTIVNEAP